MKVGLTFLAIALFFIPVGEISMLGIKINDDATKIKDINLQIIGREMNATKFRTENGNDFSITYEYGKIVYMENDWSQKANGTRPLHSDFSFGKTSVADIKSKFSSYGFVYEHRQFIETDMGLITFNCYEFDSTNNEVLVLISKLHLDEESTDKETTDKDFKLDAVIIADMEYLDRIWGADKSFYDNYKKIKM